MGLSSRSLKSVALVALFACLGAAATGCVFTDGNGGGETSAPGGGDNPPAQAQQVTIDADATLQVTGGDGVGAFVEYATGGHWHVLTACDSNEPTNPGVPCAFDVFASIVTTGATTGGATGAALSNAQGDGLDSKDSVSTQGDGSLHLSTETTTGLDGMTFDAPVGATVELDVYLDNQENADFIYWIGEKVLHQGAPSDPLDLVPSEQPAGSQGNSAGTGGGTK